MKQKNSPSRIQESLPIAPITCRPNENKSTKNYSHEWNDSTAASHRVSNKLTKDWNFFLFLIFFFLLFIIILHHRQQALACIDLIGSTQSGITRCTCVIDHSMVRCASAAQRRRKQRNIVGIHDAIMIMEIARSMSRCASNFKRITIAAASNTECTCDVNHCHMLVMVQSV